MTDRPASPGDDAVELASRYLDGDLPVDERAAAEADPAVMAWVERFGSARAALGEPIEVGGAQRDAAIAAALAVFDEDAPDVAPPPGGDELAAARARRSSRLATWLGAAAAVAAVAVGGVVLAGNSGGGGNDDFADAPTSAATEMATTLESDEQTSAFDATAPAADADAPAAGAAERTAVAADTTAAAGDAPKTGPADETAAGSSTDTTADQTLATAIATYARPEDLAVLGDALPVTLAEGIEPPCADRASGELVADPVIYAGVAAVVYRDAATHTLTAWGVERCDRLADHVYGDE